MTPDQGYALAMRQRPGVKIVMGATEAREERIAPLDIETRLEWWRSLPGDVSWRWHDVRAVCGGWLPHSIALSAGAAVEDRTGRRLTRAEWEYLHNASAAERADFIAKHMEAAE